MTMARRVCGARRAQRGVWGQQLSAPHGCGTRPPTCSRRPSLRLVSVAASLSCRPLCGVSSEFVTGRPGDNAVTFSTVRAGQRAETPRPAPRGRGTETRGRPRASWSVRQLGDRRAKGQVWPPGREAWTGADPPWGACGGHAGDGTTCCTAFPSRAETSGLLDSLEHSEHGGSPSPAPPLGLQVQSPGNRWRQKCFR